MMRAAVDSVGAAVTDLSDVVYSTTDAVGKIRVVTSAQYHAPVTPTAEGTRGRAMASATEADWKNRMVFYYGDERNFYQGGRACGYYQPWARTPPDFRCSPFHPFLSSLLSRVRCSSPP